MLADIALSGLIAVFTILMAYLGVHVTLHPPTESPKLTRRYKIGFIACGAVTVVLVVLQGVRNGHAQGQFASQLDEIKRNTKTPPTVAITNSVPPSQVIFAPTPALTSNPIPVSKLRYDTQKLSGRLRAWSKTAREREPQEREAHQRINQNFPDETERAKQHSEQTKDEQESRANAEKDFLAMRDEATQLRERVIRYLPTQSPMSNLVKEALNSPHSFLTSGDTIADYLEDLASQLPEPQSNYQENTKQSIRILIDHLEEIRSAMERDCSGSLQGDVSCYQRSGESSWKSVSVELDRVLSRIPATGLKNELITINSARQIMGRDSPRPGPVIALIKALGEASAKL